MVDDGGFTRHLPNVGADFLHFLHKDFASLLQVIRRVLRVELVLGLHGQQHLELCEGVLGQLQQQLEDVIGVRIHQVNHRFLYNRIRGRA